MKSHQALSPESQSLLARWNASAPPLRPSSEEIEAMARCWNADEGVRVLVQGATPELVDLALRKRASRVIAMDWDAPMFPAMRCLGREDWAHVENLVCDWRTFVAELEGALDLILGDCSLTMLAFPEDWEQVFHVLQRYLVPAGRMIMRLPFQLEEPLDFSQYFPKTIACIEEEWVRTTFERRVALLRGLIAEIRSATGFVSADASGTVDLDRHAALIRFCWAELVVRFGNRPEWEPLQPFLKPETEIRRGVRTRKAVPSWEAAAGLMERCGFCVRHVECSGTRPVPGATRVFAAERM
jgi:hypothetical protein